MNIYVQDESTECLLYVMIHLLILMSKYNSYVKDESTKYMLYEIIDLLILMSKMNFNVQDESMKCLPYIMIHLLILMSKMNFYVQDESYVHDRFLYPGCIYEMFAKCNNSFTYSYVQDEILCPG